MVNKKAWLRIVEAFIGVMIVISALLVIIIQQQGTPEHSDQIYERQRYILNIIRENETLRDDILNNQSQRVNENIKMMMPLGWNFSTNICNIDKICLNKQGYINKNVYSTEILVTSNLTKYNPQKLKFFVWSN